MSESFIPEYKIHILYFFEHLNCIFPTYVCAPSKIQNTKDRFFSDNGTQYFNNYYKIGCTYLLSYTSVNAKIAGTIHIYLSIRSLLGTSVGCGDHRESTVYYVEGPLPVKSRPCGCSYLISFQSGISHITPVANQLAVQSFSPM